MLPLPFLYHPHSHLHFSASHSSTMLVHRARNQCMQASRLCCSEAVVAAACSRALQPCVVVLKWCV